MVARIVNYIGSRVKVWSADVHMREVVNGALTALALKVAGSSLTFIFNLLLARSLGTDGTGLYFLAITVTTIATVFGRLGLDNALLRFTAAFAAVDNWVAVKGVYNKGVKLCLFASLVSAIMLFTTASLLSESVFHKAELGIQIRWMSLAVVPMSILILHAEMLKGLRRIKESTLVSGVGVPAISVIGIYVIGGRWGVSGAIWVYVFASVVTAIIGVWLWRKVTPQLRLIAGHFKRRELLKSSIPLFWVASSNMIISWTSMFSLGIWASKTDIGIYSVASRTAMLMSLVLISVNSISAPKFAAMYEKREMLLLESTAKKSAKLMTIMATPLLIMFLLFSEMIMGVFGSEFTKGATLLSIIAIGQFINVATGSVGYLLMMSGNVHLMRNNVFFTSLINFLLNITLVPYYGAIGAAISTAICLVVMNMIAAYLVSSRLGISTIPYGEQIVKLVRSNYSNSKK